MGGQKIKNLRKEIDVYLSRLYPILRSITGPGNRETLRILQEVAPIEIKEYPSGTPVYDWVIPDEWRVRAAWIKDAKGNKVVDLERCNVHLVSYSAPVHARMDFAQLAPRLYVHQSLPHAIPYRTSYYKRDWGFCVTHQQYAELAASDGTLEVFVDSEFNAKGSLTVGEVVIPGEAGPEILVSTYICHPSLANDNLSGAVMTAFLARELGARQNWRRGFRIVWVPETIGAIAYCAMNEERVKRIKSGLVVTCVGGPGKFGYKQSFNPHHSLNYVIEDVFRQQGIEDFFVYPFDMHGSDERQYSSQGFLINVASITKDKYYEYPYYHTSLDDLNFVRPENIERSLDLHLKVLERLDEEPVYRNRFPCGEVMLSRHGMYPQLGGGQNPSTTKLNEMDLTLWLLWLCDGQRGLYEIAQFLKTSPATLEPVIQRLSEKGLLERVI